MRLLSINQHGANHIRTGIYEAKPGAFWWFFLTEKNNRTPIGDGPFPNLEKVKENILSVLNSWERLL